MLALFITNRSPVSFLAAVIVILVVYFLEILIDNCSARIKYFDMVKLAWAVTVVLAGSNIWILMLVKQNIVN